MKLTSWSPSRLTKYEACPLNAKYEFIDKLCPKCFKGKTKGGFGTPVTCDTCHAEIESGPALVRGSRIGASLEKFIRGQSNDLDFEIENPKVIEIAKDVQNMYEEGVAEVEANIILSAAWIRLEGDFPKGAWFRGRLDVLCKHEPEYYQVIDWKTGGVDRQGHLRVGEDKYRDQLELYQLAVLSAYPGVEEVDATLCFTDAVGNPCVHGKVMRRERILDVQGWWAKRVEPMMADEVFTPNPGVDSCRYCAYKSALGGPCVY